MINLGTFILCCVLSFFMGILIGESKRHNGELKELDELKNFYHENTKSLVAYIEKMNEKKGGAD